MAQPKHETNFAPFRNIALCFSGGGFRAASYSLGVLSYFNHLQMLNDDGSSSPLLGRVQFISSTSGGSFTNLLYSYYLHRFPKEMQPFYQCFQKLYLALQGDTLIQRALEILNDPTLWENNGSAKNRNLINAFSKAYDEMLFDGQTFGVFWDKTNQPKWSLCINTSEFYRGLPFRFQTTGDPATKEVVGNQFIKFKRRETETLKKIKLADILAASSCFPSGFEPIIYPEDFTYTGKEGSNLWAAELRDALTVTTYDGTQIKPPQSIGFMDGGVSDNQALYSAMTADKRNRIENAFDLIMVSDVTSYFMDPYKVSKVESNADWSKWTLARSVQKMNKIIGVINKLYWVFGILFLLSILGLIFLPGAEWQRFGFFLLGLSLTSVLLLVYFTGLRNGSKLLRSIFSPINRDRVNDSIKDSLGIAPNFSETVTNHLYNTVQHIQFGSLYQMLQARLSSVVIMASEINLKHVRRIIYELFYKNPRWQNRRVSNFIYELSYQNLRSREQRLGKRKATKAEPADYLTKNETDILLNISTGIRNVAEEARKMGTTLWFEQQQSSILPYIIQCGQFTTCCTLLEYAMGLRNEIRGGVLKVEEWQAKSLEDLIGKLLQDWKTFNAHPEFLYESELQKISTI